MKKNPTESMTAEALRERVAGAVRNFKGVLGEATIDVCGDVSAQPPASFTQASTQLFEALGYNTTRQLQLKHSTYNCFLDTFHKGNLNSRLREHKTYGEDGIVELASLILRTLLENGEKSTYSEYKPTTSRSVF